MSMLYLGDSKRCSMCGRYKNMGTEYAKSKTAPHGIVSACKECNNGRHRKYKDRKDRFWKYFWSHTLKVDRCLEWCGRYAKGSPTCHWDGKTSASVRRVVYRLAIGDLDDDHIIVSTCRNRRCVRHSHLERVTIEEFRVILANERATGDRHWSRLRPERLPRGDRSWQHTHPERTVRGDNHWSRLRPERVLRGEKHGMAVLTEEKVRQIREMRQSGMSGGAIARAVDINEHTVWSVIYRHTWKHVH